MKHLRSIFFGLVYSLPAVLFCSYYPLFTLGNDTTMNFELSLPLIWLVIFDLTAFCALISVVSSNSFRRFSKPSREEQAATTERAPRKDGRANGAKKSRQKLLPGISDRRFFLFTFFPFYATFSAFWSPNPTRAILTAGVLWLTFFAVFAIIYILPLLAPARSFRPTLLKSIFISTSIICLICWTQCLVDVIGIPRDASLLCAGCTHQTFGFPHPSGFAIEPQFMGNLLLAPTLLSLYLLTFGYGGKQTRESKAQKPSVCAFEESPELTSEDEDAAHPRRRAERTSCPKKCEHWALVFFASLFSSTLFLTLSRGAIYAYGVALVILLIFALIRRPKSPKNRPELSKTPKSPSLQNSKKWSYIIAIPVFTSIFTLVAQGIFAAVSPTNDTFASGTTKVVHQLSLGLIDLRPQSSPEPVENSSELYKSPSNSRNNSSNSNETAPVPTNSSQFDGYIPASTNVRLGLNNLALRIWSSDPAHMLFGVGLGGAGLAINTAYPEEKLALPNAIIQNEPLSILLELGLVGVLLVIFSLTVAFFPGIFSRKFLDGRAATTRELSPSFWRHSALPLLISLIIAYLVTLNFFSGLPNALQIYLMPPLLYIIFSPQLNPESKNSKTQLPQTQTKTRTPNPKKSEKTLALNLDE